MTVEIISFTYYKDSEFGEIIGKLGEKILTNRIRDLGDSVDVGVLDTAPTHARQIQFEVVSRCND
jgi:hypothetical protein